MWDKILSELKSPPSTVIEQMPVITSYSDLPFEKLSWENFEKYCYQLGSMSMTCIDGSYIYGRNGQKQDGIDLYFNDNGFINVWQVKRYQKFTTNDITAAISTFTKGKWADKTKRFVLCVSDSLNDTSIVDTIDAQSEILKNKGIEFAVYNSSKLTLLSLEHPQLVFRFFGQHWANALGLNLQDTDNNVNTEKYWINSETGEKIDSEKIYINGITKLKLNGDTAYVECDQYFGKKMYVELDVASGLVENAQLPYKFDEYEFDIPEDIIVSREKEYTHIGGRLSCIDRIILKWGKHCIRQYDIETNTLVGINITGNFSIDNTNRIIHLYELTDDTYLRNDQ